MQKAIIIKDGSGNVLAKKVYAGDLTFADSEASRIQTKYPTYTVTEFTTDQDSVFLAATVNNPGNLPTV